jgi:hypothetical protein
MHHCSCCQGLSSFFEQLANGFRRDRLDKAQFDRFASQQSNSPMVVARGSATAGDGDQMSRLSAC